MTDWRGWKFAGIYSLRHVESDKVYVGQSQNIAKRIGQHKSTKRANTYICHAIQWYGWDAFEVVVLERIDDLALLDEREQYWIDTLHACDPQRGYNICQTAGSCRGVRHSQESCAKKSDAMKGRVFGVETRAKLSAAQQGRTKSPEAIAICVAARKAGKGYDPSAETRAKISAAGMGRKPNAETIAKLSASNLGKKRSAETRARVGAAKKGTKHSKETRAKMSAAQQGRKHSEETRAKMSAAKKTYYQKKQEDLLKGSRQCPL